MSTTSSSLSRVALPLLLAVFLSSSAATAVADWLDCPECGPTQEDTYYSTTGTGNSQAAAEADARAQWEAALKDVAENDLYQKCHFQCFSVWTGWYQCDSEIERLTGAFVYGVPYVDPVEGLWSVSLSWRGNWRYCCLECP